MAIDVGQIVDKYQLIERVGRGGMSVVYRATDTSLMRDVAIKVLHGHLAESFEVRARFEQEAVAVAKLRHENILEIYDFSGSDPDASYIVTEFINGQTLAEFLRKQTIEFPEIGAMIALEICKAVAHAHSFGVLHRDIKPENVMVRSDGRIKLMDFGIAQIVDHQRLTVTGQLLGSPAYMSPEHVVGAPLDFRTDVFALGVVLYQLVTNKLPFTGKNPHEVLKKIVDVSYVTPDRANPHIRKNLSKIAEKALEQRKEDRFQGVEDLAEALDGFLQTSELNDSRAELEHFFADPNEYQAGLHDRIVNTVLASGKRFVGNDNNAALDCFNRVLALEPDNPIVLRTIEDLSSSRWRRRGMLAALVCAIAGVAALALWPKDENLTSSAQNRAPTIQETPNAVPSVSIPTPPPLSRADIEQKETLEPEVEIQKPARHAEPKVKPTQTRTTAAKPPALRPLDLTISPKGSAYRIDNGPWLTAETSAVTIALPPTAKRIVAKNPNCCADKTVLIPKGSAPASMAIHLDFLPATITPRCNWPDVGVRIDGRLARIDRASTIALGDSLGSRQVKVEFFSDHFFETSVSVRYNQSIEVECE